MYISKRGKIIPLKSKKEERKMSIKTKLFKFEENCVKKIGREKCDNFLSLSMYGIIFAMFMPVFYLLLSIS